MSARSAGSSLGNVLPAQSFVSQPRTTRVRSQVAKVSRWSESSYAASSNREGGGKGGHTWSEVPSVATDALPERSSRPFSSNGPQNPPADPNSGTNGGRASRKRSDPTGFLPVPPSSSRYSEEPEELASPAGRSPTGSVRASQSGYSEAGTHAQLPTSGQRSSKASMNSMMRRLDQLDFGDTSSRYVRD